MTIVGTSFSGDWPTTSGALSRTNSGNQDAVLAQLDPAVAPSQQLRYGTYLGGSENEGIESHQLVLDDAGNAILAVPSRSADLGIPSDPRDFSGQQSENVLLPSDNTASTFWITNPSND